MDKIRKTLFFVLVAFTVYYHYVTYTAVHRPDNEAIHSISNVSTPASTILEEPGLKHVPRSTLSLVHPKQKLTIRNYDDNNSTYRPIIPDGMSILQDSFKFPQPIALKSKESIINSKWFMHLRDILSNWPSRYVLTLSSNSAYKEVLLNWLISAVVNAQVILDNVLVMAFDEEVYQFVAERGITSVHIPFEDILSVDVVNLRGPSFRKVMTTRLAVIRLINYWGFDVVQFDSDAIVLRNPLSLFELHQDSNIVSSLGIFPHELGAEWGATMCAGLVMFRNTRQTGMYNICLW